MAIENLNSVGRRISTLLAEPRDTSLRFYVKRCFDVTLAVILLILLLPLLLLIAILIKVDSLGPVLFIQERVGARRESKGRQAAWSIVPFQMYKFRTMFHNADQSLHKAHIKAFAEGKLDTSKGGTFKLIDDPRITRFGRFLRKTSLDELPQLLNVIKGEMSLVGPRPVPEYEVKEYADWHFERFTSLPGVSGLWQVEGRSLVTMDEMVKLDIEYNRQRSIRLDLKLMLMTIPSVLFEKGAG